MRVSASRVTAGAGLASGATLLLGACGKHDSTKSELHAQPHGVRHADIEMLNRALDLENKTIAAYTAAIPLLHAGAQRAARQFLSQDLSHAGELTGLIKEAGGHAHGAKASYQLGTASTPAQVIQLLLELENQQIQGYVAAIPKLTPGSVRAAVASILANDAQHEAMLRASARMAPLISPFVTGRQ